MTSFNDGIEAAAQAYELAGYPEDARVIRLLKRPEPSEADTQKIGEAMREAVRNVCKGPTLSDELTDGQYAALFRAALKAMEEERVEKVAAAIERELMVIESLLADPATLRKIKSQRIARAALKAMGGGA